MRDNLLITIRPSLNLTSDIISEFEEFQNRTLRPILKFQNELIIRLAKTKIKKLVPQFNAYSGGVQKKEIENRIKKDAQFRSILFSSVIGLFTLDELQFYESHEKEINKRMASLIIKRIQDQMESLI